MGRQFICVEGKLADSVSCSTLISYWACRPRDHPVLVHCVPRHPAVWLFFNNVAQDILSFLLLDLDLKKRPSIWKKEMRLETRRKQG